MFNEYKKGFTLIELLVVISIISLLSSIILASLSGARSKAKDVARIRMLLEVQKAVELYVADNGSYPEKSVCIPTHLSTGLCGGDPGSLSPELDKYIKITLNLHNWVDNLLTYAGGGAQDGSGLWYFGLNNKAGYKLAYVGIDNPADIPLSLVDNMTFQSANNCDGKVAAVWSTTEAKNFILPAGNFAFSVSCP